MVGELPDGAVVDGSVGAEGGDHRGEHRAEWSGQEASWSTVTVVRLNGIERPPARIRRDSPSRCSPSGRRRVVAPPNLRTRNLPALVASNAMSHVKDIDQQQFS